MFSSPAPYGGPNSYYGRDENQDRGAYGSGQGGWTGGQIAGAGYGGGAGNRYEGGQEHSLDPRWNDGQGYGSGTGMSPGDRQALTYSPNGDEVDWQRYPFPSPAPYPPDLQASSSQTYPSTYSNSNGGLSRYPPIVSPRIDTYDPRPGDNQTFQSHDHLLSPTNRPVPPHLPRTVSSPPFDTTSPRIGSIPTHTLHPLPNIHPLGHPSRSDLGYATPRAQEGSRSPISPVHHPSLPYLGSTALDGQHGAFSGERGIASPTAYGSNEGSGAFRSVQQHSHASAQRISYPSPAMSMSDDRLSRSPPPQGSSRDRFPSRSPSYVRPLPQPSGSSSSNQTRREDPPPAMGTKRNSMSKIDPSAILEDFNGQGMDEEEAFNLAIAKSLSLDSAEEADKEAERQRRDRRIDEEEEDAVATATAMSLTSPVMEYSADDVWIRRNGGDSVDDQTIRDESTRNRKETSRDSVAGDGVSVQDIRDELSRRETAARLPEDPSRASGDGDVQHIAVVIHKEKPLPPGPYDTAFLVHPLPVKSPGSHAMPSPSGPQAITSLIDPIPLLPGPSTLQIIAPSLSQVLRDLIALGPLQVEPSPEAFAIRKDDSKDPSWECRCWLWFLKCEGASISTKRGYRTILVLESVELGDWRDIPLQRVTTSNSVAGTSTAGPSTAATSVSSKVPKPPAALRVDDGANPILPPYVSSEIAYVDLGAPLVMPFRLETLVERLYTIQKMGKTIAASAAVPETGSKAFNALKVWNLIQKYPGPAEGDGKVTKPVKKEPLLALGRRISKDPASNNGRSGNGVVGGSQGDDGLSVHGRYSKTAALRKAASKVIGKVSSGRADQMDDEREEWITPFVTQPQR